MPSHESGEPPEPIPVETLPTAATDPLESGEQPVVLLAGTAFERRQREGNTTPVRKVAAPGDRVLTLVTDRRVLVIVERAAAPSVESLSLDRVTDVGDRTQGTDATLRIRTLNWTYLLDVSDADQADRAGAIEYLRRSSTVADGTREANESDPLDRLERLAALYDEGALTEAEFTETKRALLDRL